MVATRSSARISTKTTKSSDPRSAVKPKRGIDSEPELTSAAEYSKSELPLHKRRRTAHNSASTPSSGAVSPASFEFTRDGTTETPATSNSDGETDDDPKDKDNVVATSKGKGKEVDPSFDSELSSNEDDIQSSKHSDYESEYDPGELKPNHRDRKGKQKAVIQDYEESDEPEYSGGDSDYDSEEELQAKHRRKNKQKQSTIREGPISYTLPPSPLPLPPLSRRPGNSKRKFALRHHEQVFEEGDIQDYRGKAYIEREDCCSQENCTCADDSEPVLELLSRAPHGGSYDPSSRNSKFRYKLTVQHPELRTHWKDLLKRPIIPAIEDPQPAGLSLNLLPFQKEGLHWLRLQEQSTFRGGILADEMGMGKTIQTLALIMSDPSAKPNLVVAPTVAIMQWKSEIEKYTGTALSVYIFHGSSKTSDHKALSTHNVILTTYNLLESVFRKQETGFKRKAGLAKETSALHKINYHRVILDEAHNIKDRNCNTAKAVFALNSKYKLCLSGTPLQNRIGELFSLLRFLEVDPFSYYFCRDCSCKKLQWKFSNYRFCSDCGHSPMSHHCLFNLECLKPIQTNGSDEEGRLAFRKIHLLMKHIMLRRTKNQRSSDLGLPTKVMRIRRDNFSEEELDIYDSIYSDGKRKFNTYVSEGVVLNNYANIFTLITRMRQMANHPDLVLRRESEGGYNTIVCIICDEEADDAISSKCHHKFCRDCVQRYVSGFDGDSDPECPKCHIGLAIDLTQPAIEVDILTVKKNSIVSRIDMSKWRSSTKIEALCEELHKLHSSSETTKCIVFSQFTSMLQLIEWRLHRAGFKTVMLEGSMSPSQREATINHFMQNVDVEVFLVSLKAGGIALNLIEANHVFLMEPWWNPSVEWQAADRIHRIGQKRTCKITRMVIENSIESRIIELQEKKTNMIQATVNADMAAMSRLTTDDMQFLFQN